MNTEKIFRESMSLNEDDMDAEELKEILNIIPTHLRPASQNGTVIVDFELKPRVIIENEMNGKTNFNSDDPEKDDLQTELSKSNEQVEIIGIVRNKNKPISSKVYRQKEWKISCDEVIDAFEFLRSFQSEDTIENLDEIALLKFDIKENFQDLNTVEIQQMSSQLSDISAVVVFESRKNGKFDVYWKSKIIRDFMGLKTCCEMDTGDNVLLSDFIEEFLMESLKSGHLGLSSSHPHTKNFEKLDIKHLADHRNYNLLQLAAESGNEEITKILLKSDISKESTPSPQSFAYNNEHFDVLLVLLQANFPYPSAFDVEKCPENVRNFYKITEELHEAIMDEDMLKIEKILSENTGSRHFYNKLNESALKIALDIKSIEIYKTLVRNNISLGPHEELDEIYEEFTFEERKILRQIQLESLKSSSEKHIDILMSNSFVSYDEPKVDEKYKLIHRAYKILNELPYIAIILKIVAASKKVKIIFDFNHNSLINIDPTSNPHSKNIFYISGSIYIAAKELLNPQTENEVIGGLAQEFCHFALVQVFKNDSNPYSREDSVTKAEFEEISKICREDRKEEETIEMVYDCYPEEMHHAMLIVRVPYIQALYHNRPEKLSGLRKVFNRLYGFYDNKVMSEMMKALPEIENRVDRELEEKENIIKRLRKQIFLVLIVATVIIVLMLFLKNC